MYSYALLPEMKLLHCDDGFYFTWGSHALLTRATARLPGGVADNTLSQNTYAGSFKGLN